MLKPVANSVIALTTPVCRKLGFVKASIILDWEQIVSTALANVCEPLKITFALKQKDRGVLHLRTSSSLALMVSYQEPQILERINRYYGYQAIAKVVIHQGPIVRKPDPDITPMTPLSIQQQNAIKQQITVPAGLLNDALLSLGCAVWQKEYHKQIA